MRLTRLVAADINVNLPAKRALLAGQFHQLRRVVTDPDNFAFEMARVICWSKAPGPSRAVLLLSHCRGI